MTKSCRKASTSPAQRTTAAIGRSTIYRWISEGSFPKPVSLGGHAVAWQECDIEEWIDDVVSRGES